ncbi:chondroitin AC/alginate lyase [Tricholoma matsutake]|nr:chondroitin AC/alginate lyase [Tricholoma matsutake 945]
MRSPLFATFLFSIPLFGGIIVHATAASYANVFVDPDFIVARQFANNTLAAQQTIVTWAQELAGQGPWTVMSKNVTPPSGDKHDYMSWAPYSWPDCSKVGNTTALTPEEVWTTCPYVTRDGQFNPDRLQFIDDIGGFFALSDAVLYNSIAYALDGKLSNPFSQIAVSFIQTWFLNNNTRMNPNLNYAQMQRGPGGQIGSHTGILDLKSMAKIATGILIFRKSKCTDWTPDIDNQMNVWIQQYTTWLETANIALEEAFSTNNHGTFYYNQLASLKLLLNDTNGARNVTDTYFNTLYKAQINATGEQPLEASRTHPYHYRAYNLAAMITNARIAAYTGESSVWNKTTTQGATIQTALEFAMTVKASASNETDGISELYSIVADIAAVYGDLQGKYIAFLRAGEPTYATDGFFLWDQPLPGGEKESAGIRKNGTSAGGTGNANKTPFSVAVINGRSLFSTVAFTIASAAGSILVL